jgi:enoyl-CoA hydratase/carnithine racemase
MDSSGYRALDVKTVDGVTTITINRPEVRNAINAELHHEFTLIWPEVDADADTDVVVLQGSGGSFCSGGDLQWLLTIAGDPVKIANSIRADRRITDEILSVEKPLIAKVDGAAELDAVADAMVQRMLSGAKYANRFTKASINAGLRQVATAVVDRAASYEGLTMTTYDFRIALEAFAAKESAVFKGR